MNKQAIEALENVLKILEFRSNDTPEEKQFVIHTTRGYVLSLLNRIGTLIDSDDEDMALGIISGMWPNMANQKYWEAHAKLRNMIVGRD